MQSNRELELTKRQIRSKILLKLTNQKEEDRERKSQVIKEKLFHTHVFRKAKRIMFYVAFKGEVKTQEMIKEAQKLGKIIAVPVCAKKDCARLRPCLLKENAKLIKGPYGVSEPATQIAVNLKKLDLVIVPAVAFDRDNNRLGRGKGCYDRFLTRIPDTTPTIGLAFSFQILPALPSMPTDVRVKKILFA